MVNRKKNFNTRYFLFFTLSHLAIGFTGFLLGIYTLPLITAKDPKDSDFFHWDERQISISKEKILFQGNLSPGPNYKLYLTKNFVTDEEDFFKAKNPALKIGAINSFNGFILELPKELNLENYNSVVIWCESFSEFITAAQYRN